MKTRICAVVFSVLGTVSATAQQDLDVVLAGGRVLDPESGLYAPLPEERTKTLYQLFEIGLREGGLGIGMPHAYTPGADRREIFRVFEFASEKKVPIYTHVRQVGVEAVQEVVANAAATGGRPCTSST